MSKQTRRIRSLMNGLYAGPNWVSVDILSTINDLSAGQAAERVLPQSNTIWEIVMHMIGWRKNILRRVQGEHLPSPGHNYFTEINDFSDEAWSDVLDEFRQTQVDWLEFLETFDEEDYDKTYENPSSTYYEFVHGIIQHDYYHLGQIKMMVKYV